MTKTIALDGRIPHREQNEHGSGSQDVNVKTKFAPPIPATPQAAKRFRQELDHPKPSR